MIESKLTADSLDTLNAVSAEILASSSQDDIVYILTKNSAMKAITRGNILCILASKKDFQPLRQIEINYPSRDKRWLISRIRDASSYSGLNDTNSEKIFSLRGYNTVSYGLSRLCEKRVAFFSFSKPRLDIQRSMHLLRALAPYLHMALNNIQYLEKSKSRGDVNLSKREVEILHWVSRGKTNWEIGMILGISGFTVKNHIANIHSKLQVVNRAQAVEAAIEIGCIG